MPRSSNIVWLWYVPHAQIVRYLCSVWIIEDELHFTNHGECALVMRWSQEGSPPDARE